MNFVFILDTSASMLQKAYNRLSLLDFGKIGIEYFIKSRQRFPESRFDTYHVFTTNFHHPEPLSSWDNEMLHLIN